MTDTTTGPHFFLLDRIDTIANRYLDLLLDGLRSTP